MTHFYSRRLSAISTLTALLLATLAGSSMAQSPDYNSSWYIAPSINSMNPDNKFGTSDNGSGWALRFGKPVSQNWDIQMGIRAAKSEQGGLSYKQETIGLDGLYLFSRESFRPFVLLGLGTQHDQTMSNAGTLNNTSPYLSAGLGAQWSLNDRWGMQADIRRAHAHMAGNDFPFVSASTTMFNIGLTYAFGAAPAPAPVALAPPEPRVIYVEAPPVATPPPAPVAPTAAPMPAPIPAPMVVAPRFERTTLAATELFAFDSYAISTPQKKLDEIARVMQRYPDVHMVMITGYTDRLGAETYNQNLSQRRADAVKSYLMQQGVSANRLNAAGKGESNPIAVCTDKKHANLVECLAPNRRVEVEQFVFERRVQ
ncbi:MAG: OmpA family protein [Cytophagales bacterium]|nr:OmpA family protein [Cytophagales bacterium]